MSRVLNYVESLLKRPANSKYRNLEDVTTAFETVLTLQRQDNFPEELNQEIERDLEIVRGSKTLEHAAMRLRAAARGVAPSNPCEHRQT